MRINTIAMDDQLQPRVIIDDGLRDECAVLVQQCLRFPPVVVFHHEGAHLPAYDFHHVHAARVAGLDQIEAEVRQGGRQAALRHSLATNAEHGQRRSSGDYQRACRIAVTNDLLDSADVDAFASILRCTSRWARSLTQDARDQRTVERNAAICQKTAGQSSRKIAVEVGVSHTGVEKIITHGNVWKVSGSGQPGLQPGEVDAATTMHSARALPGADFWRRDPDPEPPPSPVEARPATSPEDDARLAATIERQRNSQGPRGRRWMAAIILLEQFET